ncbi:hypothetical protein KC19_VG188800 [Ceratodon purpureus]|uniref:Uncharacterized protein n=1 Tax=Ceratodon purpureus TaxID=3225 RepID=A0A8T0HRK8_CERPU|nr:hypothetical protein KC19_VG188800 [Ceratodon purpureus]
MVGQNRSTAFCCYFVPGGAAPTISRSLNDLWLQVLDLYKRPLLHQVSRSSNLPTALCLCSYSFEVPQEVFQ